MENENTRELIVKALVELIKEKGYNETSISDICRRANITRSTFYYHYTSKEDVLSFLRLEVNPAYALLKSLESIDDPWQKIWILTRDALEQLQLNYGKDVIRAALANNISRGMKALNVSAEGIDRVSIPLAEQCRQRGIYRSTASPEELAFCCSVMFIGFVTMWATDILQGDIYEQMLAAMQAVYDIRPEYRLSADYV